MFQQKWHWLLLIVGVVVLGVGWITWARVPAATTANATGAAPRVGFNAPAIQTTTPSGGALDLEQQRGKVVVLNFWATWCGPCRAEMPALQSLYATSQRDGLIVIGINQLEGAESVMPFVRELQLQFPIGLDREGVINRQYQVRALPSTFFIDRHGVIRDVVVGGPVDLALLQSKVESLLTEP